MAFRLTPRARIDLALIYDRGLTEFGRGVAEEYLAGFEKVAAFLGEFPRAARERTEVDPPVRAHPYRSHMIIYEIVDEDVVILRVRHGREDWQGDP